MNDLTADDLASVDRAARELHARGWSQPFSLDQMLASWTRLVSEVEQGYDAWVDDYTNDLTCRDWLALAWPLLSPRVQEARQGELNAADERFVACTDDDGGRAIGRYYRVEATDGWWWRRRPTSTAGMLAAELAASDVRRASDDGSIDAP